MQNIYLKAQDSFYLQLIKDFELAHILEKGQVELSFKAGAINDQIDVFNFKQDIAESASIDLTQFSDFGDWQSYDTTINFGISKRFATKLTFGVNLIEIGKSEAEIQHYGFELKVLALSEFENLPAISFSFGADTHIANNITGDINAITFTLGDIEIQQSFSPPESLTVGGLNDQNYYVGIHFGKIVTDNLLIYSFHKFSLTMVDSEFQTSLQIGQFQKLKDDFAYDEWSYKAGFGLFYQAAEWCLATLEFQHGYYNRDFNDNNFAGSNEKNSNKLDIAFHFFVFNNTAITIGGWANSNFLAGEIPLIYNKKSASKFDNPYGQIYFSITFGWDMLL
ncbi:MAG: hypothetical protein COA79_13685 [Planctomycetota bacterium]|nr:MAG: hypothetical protein COA79_13685 [Planctomycetota bacterium]